MFSIVLFIIIGITIHTNWIYWVCFSFCVLEKLIRWGFNRFEHYDFYDKSKTFIKYVKDSQEQDRKVIDILDEIERHLDK